MGGFHNRKSCKETKSCQYFIVFVGVELQTTGSWSGSEWVSIFKMRIKEALFDLFGGRYSQTLRKAITPV